ncbi:hypothetical protein KUTeg_023016 [Tegillarca granosa]|uniref:B box-type domain-containing protein n=1 Tax=Tegillarca granosa TaxID=220873 RepID=A0ABQ9E0F2_TEGGR|nr:hypothetical protein KUTeg_023016 [Tegillarca granosa]
MDEGRKQDHLCPGDKPVCDLCDTKIDHELSKCLACNVYMCRTCTTAHQKVLATKQHNIVARVEWEPSKLQNVSQMCKTHKDEEIAFYCYTCNDFICSECILGDHKGFCESEEKRNKCKTKHGDIIATDNNKPSLHKLTKEGVKTQTISTSPLQCTGICEASAGKLLVCFLDKLSYVVDNSSRRLVSKITMGGNIIESYEHHNGSRLFTWPQGVSENINKDICVVDRTSKTSGRLVVMDKTGKLKYTYEGQKLPQPFDPFYVKCDKSGHVIVNDFYNTKVHMLDMDGRFIRYIADENILKNDPFSLEFDKNGVLWVGCYNGNVYKLKY